MRLLLLFAVLVLGPVQSAASEQTPSYRAALLDALAAKDTALDTGRVEDWTRTLDLLRRADTMRTAAITKYEIAFAAAHLGRVAVALENYGAAIVLGLPARASARAQEYIVSHLPQVAQLQIEGPANTMILLDGEEWGRLPFSRFAYVTPGTVMIEAVFSDGRKVTRTLKLNPGQIARTVVEPDEAMVTSGTTPSDATTLKEPDHERANHEASLLRQDRSAAKQRHSERRHTEWTLAATGATVTVLSAAFLPLAYSRLSSSRNALRHACEAQTDGPDTCAHAKQGRWDEAQSASNSIATWKMTRVVSWVGLVTGLTVGLGSIALLLRSPSANERPATSVQLSLGPRELQLSYSLQSW